MFKKNFLCLLLSLIVTTVSAALEIQVDKENIANGETLTLQITSKNHLSLSPDLSPLNKDFYVLARSQSSQVNIINGSVAMETQWQIALLPKHVGDIVIPSIQIGNEKTPTHLVHVLTGKVNNAAPTPTGPSKQDIFIEATVVPKESYIQEQFVYTLKLYYNRTIENPYLVGPDLTDAKIAQNGQDIIYTNTKNGKYYRVLERSYLITPKNVGHFQIQPPVLKGYLERQRSAFGGYGFSTVPAQPIKIIGPSISINVKPKPATFAGQWLPAKKLTLQESWDKKTGYREGEPITRLIEVNVKGATGEQIPALKLNSLSNVNIYPEQPQRDTSTSGDTQIGKMKQKIVYIPTASGKIQLPAIKVHWWNSNSKKEEITVLPSRTLTVLPALTKGSARNMLTASSVLPTNKSVANANPKPVRNLLWPILAFVFATIWLLTLILWRRQMKTGIRKKAKPAKINLSDRQKLLREACITHNAKHARKQFLLWAVAYWNDNSLHALSDIISLLHEEEAKSLQAQIMQLESVFYSRNKVNWNGSEFWSVLQEYLKSKIEKNNIKQDPLPPLYPSEAPS